MAELLLQKPFFLESIIKCFLNIWLYKHRKNKHHIFFKSRVSLPELNALLSAGCPWRLLPHDFPVWQTVYEYFRNWRSENIWAPINRQLSQWVRISGGKEATPSMAITNSQSVQIGSTQLEPQAVGCATLDGRRTFGWFNWSRCQSKDYEILTDTSEAFLHIARIRLSLRRLA